MKTSLFLARSLMALLVYEHGERRDEELRDRQRRLTGAQKKQHSPLRATPEVNTNNETRMPASRSTNDERSSAVTSRSRTRARKSSPAVTFIWGPAGTAVQSRSRFKSVDVTRERSGQTILAPLTPRSSAGTCT